LSPEIDRLMDIALEKQNHIGDLLLLKENGFYEKKIAEYNKINTTKLNPHVIGPSHEGHSEHAHCLFIHKYRTNNIHKLSYKKYLEEIEYAPEKRNLIDKLIELEETTIQLEMLIYLKFWEADLIIKKLYQFVRILNGEHYDWYFKISESQRDKNSTGKRQDIIRLKIRDKLKKTSPLLYDLIKNTYKTQIRNSIAHSNYSFLGRNIHLNNHIEDDSNCQLETITFDEWIDIFHSTIIFHNELIRMNNIINDYYRKMAMKHDNIFPIMVTEKDGKQYELPLEYRPRFNDWKYKQI